MTPDADRLRAVFDRPGLGWIVTRLVERMSRGRPLSGFIGNAQATADERRALDDLLGRRSTSGGRLSLDLSALEQNLRLAGLAATLEDVVMACRGPVTNQRAETERERDQWVTLFDAERSRYADQPALLSWVDALARDGTLKRLCRGDVVAASGLMEKASRVVSRTRDPEVLLANLAAECAGDSHALDRGQPLATLCVRAIARLHGIDGQVGTDARRKAWAAMGVVIDDLSAPVLTFNLRGGADSPLESLLKLYRQHGQPAFLTYRQLQGHNQFQPLEPAMRTIFVCENPSVVSAAAREVGGCCRPLVCTNGQPNSTAHLLLAQLRQAGAELQVHADFDWAGLRIVDQLRVEHGAIPWRMSAEDYRTTSGTVSLDPQPFTASWSLELADAIRGTRRAVYEEQVMRSLLADLSEVSVNPRRPPTAGGAD